MSASINAYVDFESVLRVLFGDRVPVRSLPAMVPCAYCTRKKRNRYFSPEDYTVKVSTAPEGGNIWYCYKCETAYDSIELLSRVKHNKNIHETVEWVAQSNEFPGLPAWFTSTDNINEYISRYLNPHVNCREWMSESSKYWSKLRDTNNILAQQIGIRVNLVEPQSSAERGAGRWIHPTTIEKLQHDLNQGMPVSANKRYFRTCLAIPWMNTMGRMCALWLVGWHNHNKMWFPQFNDREDAGIMLLNAIPRNPKRVIAVSSPYLAMHLQYHQLKEIDKPAAVVAWHTRTDPSVWHHVNADEVVFWGYEPTPDIFRQALTVPNSKVSFIKNINIDIEYTDGSIESPETWSKMRNRLDQEQIVSARRMIASLCNRVEDPLAACKNYLLGLDMAVAPGVMDVIGMDPETMNRLLEAAVNYEERAQLERVFDSSFRQREIVVRGSVLREFVGPSGVKWVIYRGGKSELISDTVIRLDKAIPESKEEGVEKFYTGHCIYRDQKCPFTATYEELSKGLHRIAMTAVEEHAGKVPVISMAHTAFLWDAMLKFSPTVDTIKTVTRSGWDSDKQAFMLPRILVQGGKFETRGMADVSGNVLPGMKLTVPPEIDSEMMDRWLEPTEANGTMWAIAAAVCDNIISTVRHQRPRGIGIVGTLPREASQKFAQELGLMIFNAEHIRTRFDDFERTQRCHDLPVLTTETDDCSALSPTTLSWISSPTPKNVLMHMSESSMSTAMVSGNWIIVRNEDEGDIRHLGDVSHLVLRYLAHFQTAQYMEPDTSRVYETLGDMRAWAEAIANRDGKYVFKHARDSLLDYGRDSSATRFVYMIAQFLNDGLLSRDYGVGFTSKSPDVIIDSEKRRVLIGKSRVLKAAHKKKLPDLDTAAVTDSLKREGALLESVDDLDTVWSIKESFWNTHVKEWKKVNLRTVRG